jgi:hypothetical protein
MCYLECARAAGVLEPFLSLGQAIEQVLELSPELMVSTALERPLETYAAWSEVYLRTEQMKTLLLWAGHCQAA